MDTWTQVRNDLESKSQEDIACVICEPEAAQQDMQLDKQKCVHTRGGTDSVCTCTCGCKQTHTHTEWSIAGLKGLGKEAALRELGWSVP